jgi:chaperonin cofactor prefoldin
LALFDEILESSQAVRNLDEVNERFRRGGSRAASKVLETAAIWAEASFHIAEAMEGAASTAGESVEGSIPDVLGVGADAILFPGRPFAAHFAAGLALASGIAKGAAELAKKEVEVRPELFEKLESKLDKLEGKAENSEDKLGRMEGKLDKLEAKADQAEGKLEKLEPRIDKLEPKLNSLGPKIDKLQPKLDEIQSNQSRSKEFWQISPEAWTVTQAIRAGVRLKDSSNPASPKSQAFSVGSIHVLAPGFMVIKIVVDGISTDVTGRNIISPSNVLVDAGISLMGASHSVQIEFGISYTGPIEFSGEKPQGLDMCTFVEGPDASQNSPNPCA